MGGLIWAISLQGAAAAPLAELTARGGLPNFFAKVSQNQEVRVAFLGGSITVAPGWRIGIMERLRQEYPQAKFTEVFAAVSGTGSDYGACRLRRDALQFHPDLLFVEFAVNDQYAGYTPDRIRDSMEGIVRQTWEDDSKIDICFVYTLSELGLTAVKAGSPQATTPPMEEVAERYGIPSVNFGPEVVRQLTAGKFVFKGPAGPAVPGAPLIFSNDGTHPTPAGHVICTDVLDRSLKALAATGAAGPHELGAPLSAKAWDPASVLLIGTMERTGTWTALDAGSPQLRQAGKLAPPTWRAETAGSTVAFTFTGTQLGLVGLKSPENGEFQVAVDNLPPVQDTLFDLFSQPDHTPLKAWFYPTELSPGEHHVTITLLATPPDKAAIFAKAHKTITDNPLYAKNVLHLCGILVADPGGKPAGGP